MLEVVFNWYFTLKKDYSKSLDMFYIINYMRHDFYTHGMSRIQYVSPSRISFREQLKNGEQKLVVYKILNYGSKTYVKREVNNSGNYFGPFDFSIEFEDKENFILIKTYRGDFMLPKQPVDKSIRKILLSF